MSKTGLASWTGSRGHLATVLSCHIQPPPAITRDFKLRHCLHFHLIDKAPFEWITSGLPVIRLVEILQA